MTALAPSNPTSLTELERELAQAKAAAMHLRLDLAPLDKLRGIVAHWTTETMLDPAQRPVLESASAELRQAVAKHAEYAKASRRVDELQAQVGDMQHQQRMDRIEDSNKRLDAAIARYDYAAKETCRAYQALLEAQQQAHRTPGARTSIPDGPSFPHMVPEGWNGTTAEHIRDGSLRWMVAEKELAA